MSCGIYLVTNIINNCVYVGKSNNIEVRWRQHKSAARTNKDNTHFHNAINKYGEENFIVTILEEIPIDKYNEISSEREQYWIKQYNAYENPSNYNTTEGGEGLIGWKPSNEWKDKQSALKKEWYKTEKGIEKRKRQSEMLKNNPLPHNKHTEEWKINHSIAMTGENNPMYGKHSNGKQCKCIELNMIFESTREAAKYLNKQNHQSIAKCCRKEQHTAYGYHWEYIE